MPVDEPVDALVRAATGARRITETRSVQSLWGGYGRILRCHLEGADQPSVIVKHVRWPARACDDPPAERSHARKVESYRVESTWYREHADRCDDACRVPRCLAQRSHGDELLLVLEDLDAAGFEHRRPRMGERELATGLHWLASFHATFMGRAPQGLWPTGTYWHLATRPDELAALGDHPLRRAAAAIDRALSATPFQTFVHGDAKLSNFCFSADGRRVAAVDFQYVGGGCGMKDVAYFLSSCLSDDECERREGPLLDLYFDRLAAALHARGSAIDVAALVADWRALYPVAWTDFYRFLQGWSPESPRLHRYSERLAREVMAAQ